MAESLLTAVTLGVSVALGAFILLAGADYVLGESAPLGRSGPTPIELQRQRQRRVLAGWAAIVGLFAAVALGFIWGPVLLAAPPSPLQAFGPATGAGPIYIGTDSSGEVVYAMVSDGVVEYTFNLGNTGDSALTITGLDERLRFSLESSEGLVPAESAPSHAHDAVFATAPFTIDAHSSRTVTLLFRLVSCPAFGNVPTLAPGISPSASMADQLRNSPAVFGVGYLQLLYTTAAGSTGTVALSPPTGLNLAGNDASACSNLTPAPTR